MRYSKSMIEAVKQVGLYEALDYAIVDGDNKIIGLYKGSNGKKQAELNMKGAERQVGVKKPLKVRPVSKKKVGDTVIGIGEQPLTDKDREDIDETIKEDGHTDVSSAVRQCKTITEDAMQIMGKLKSMSGEDSLPTWWTNKLAVASNSVNKMRDYLLVPSDGMNEQLQEAMGDLEDMKKVVKELEKASKMHLAQSKRVAAHIGAMEKNEKTKITSKELLNNKFKEEKNGAQHFSKVNEDNYVWNFVYYDFGRTKLTTEPDKATHLVYTMEGQDNPQLLKISEREILDYKKGENNGLSKK